MQGLDSGLEDLRRDAENGELASSDLDMLITMLTVLVGMIVTAGAAAYFPARRIATIDPAATLRED